MIGGADSEHLMDHFCLPSIFEILARVTEKLVEMWKPKTDIIDSECWFDIAAIRRVVFVSILLFWKKFFSMNVMDYILPAQQLDTTKFCSISFPPSTIQCARQQRQSENTRTHNLRSFKIPLGKCKSLSNRHKVSHFTHVECSNVHIFHIKWMVHRHWHRHLHIVQLVTWKKSYANKFAAFLSCVCNFLCNKKVYLGENMVVNEIFHGDFVLKACTHHID